MSGGHFDDNNVWIPYGAIGAMNHSIDYKFNKNDKVINKTSNAKGTILSQATDAAGVKQYYVEYEDQWHSNSFEPESNLEFWSQPLTKTWIKCECGSDVTYGKEANAHSSWCPKFVDNSLKSD